jgi:hypothetical protein
MDLPTILLAAVVGLITAAIVWRLMSGPLARCMAGLMPQAASSDFGRFARFAVLASGMATAAARSGFLAAGISRGGPGSTPSGVSSNVILPNAIGAAFSSLSACVGALLVLFLAALAGHVLLKGFAMLRGVVKSDGGAPET